jgi:hypothetical protein
MTAGDTDYTLDGWESDLGGMTQAEIVGRGRIHALIADETVALMEERVRKTGILERLEEWRLEDATPWAMGGRPSLISDRALLTALMLLAKESSAMYLTGVRDLFRSRLSDKSRELLELESCPEAFLTHIGDKKRWYDNTSRAFNRINALMDPFPQERWKSKSLTEIDGILRDHDAELAVVRKARLDEFTRRFLVMTYREQPRWIRRRSDTVDISFDQTFVSTPTVKGYSRKNLRTSVASEAKVIDKRALTPGPVDAFAGWHVTNGERTDNPRGQTDLTEPSSKGAPNYRWGWEANLAVRVDSAHPGKHRFPGLVMAATMSLPNVNVSEEAVSLMRAAKETGLQPGVGDADKQYWANALQTRLHDPAFAEGFTPSTDYRVDRLGPQGGDHGAKYIEGKTYCPGTPKPLQQATVDMQSGIIDTATYRQRIAKRKAFQLHQKEKPDAKGRVVLRCPAIGPSPSVTCPLRELLKTKKVLPAVDEQDAPDFADKICAQHSVSFDTAKIRRQEQAFDYGTEEWDTFHTHARNSIESLNAQVKSKGAEDLESANRRRVRGFGAAQIIVTMLLTNFNIRKIAAFISDEMANDAKQSAPGQPAEKLLRRRDREFHNPYTDTYPAGVERPKDAKRQPTSNDTGGPPLRT